MPCWERAFLPFSGLRAAGSGKRAAVTWLGVAGGEKSPPVFLFGSSMASRRPWSHADTSVPSRCARFPSRDGAQTRRPTVMQIIGLDLHLCDRPLPIKADDGTVNDGPPITTSRKRFTAVFGGRTRAYSARGDDREEVGGTPPSPTRARGDRGRSEQRVAVRQSHARRSTVATAAINHRQRVTRC